VPLALGAHKDEWREDMTKRIRGGASKLTLAMLAATAVLAVSAGAASAASEPVYNNIPSPLPGNLPSLGFEANQTSEFGGQVGFEGTARKNPTIKVTMSSWGCVTGHWYEGNCGTPAGTKFEWPLTISIYEVGPENSVGSLIARASKTYKMPYRPSANFAKCNGADAGKWYSTASKACFNGKAFNISIGLKVAKLPENVIIGVAFNTSEYGAEPQGTAPCSGSSGGCPYDSLNMAVREAGEGGPSLGSDPASADAYINSTTAGNYCENPGGVGTFALSKNCWTEEQPAFEVKAH
jgi:hypothetical protein